MWTVIATWGALIGLAIAIVLIIFKLHPVYALVVGALVGGLIGSAGNIQLTVTSMVDGAKGMVFTILRILTSGILAGALIKTGSAEKIATTIVPTAAQNAITQTAPSIFQSLLTSTLPLRRS